MTEDNLEAYNITQIPFKTRLVNACVVSVLTIGIGILLISETKPNEYENLIWGLIFILGGCYFVRKIMNTTETKALAGVWIVNQNGEKVFILSAAAKVEQQRLLAENLKLEEINVKKSALEAEKWAQIEGKWWFRYGLATLILLGAWWFSELKPDYWWVSLIAILVAMVYAHELSIFIIGLLALWLIGQGLTSLSVTGAILVGACIIAFAISNSK